MNKTIMNTLIQLSNKALKNDEVPVACVLVKNNKIVSKAYNNKEKIKNPLCHAEIMCINKLCKKINDWRLGDYEMYVTLKPCDMCLEVIKASRIKKVYYILDAPKSKNIEKVNLIKIDENSEEFKEKITSFFKQKR